jgi:CDP-paratose 2-epimerase
MKILVSGVGGLVGAAVARRFGDLAEVFGIENNTRRDLFGPSADISQNLKRLQKDCPGLRVEVCDIRSAETVLKLCEDQRFDAFVHCAGQPSHDLSGRFPALDFSINVVGTHNLLEAARLTRPDAPFVFLSTNKVYGDFPNSIPLRETHSRFEPADPASRRGFGEDAPIDQLGHTPFGAHKAAADLIVQEYGRFYRMPTVCLRAGCLTGAGHASVSAHGFLSYLIRTALRGGSYIIEGHKGKQVRDNLAASDLAELIALIISARPQGGVVYNVGGGAANAVSILEAIECLLQWQGVKLRWSYSETPRWGDHIWYVTDLARVCRDYPQWEPRKDLRMIFDEIAAWSSDEAKIVRG